MSSATAAVAASDPGGDGGRGGMERQGQPEVADVAVRESVTDGEVMVEGNLMGIAGDADVTMVEAATDEVAAVAGVKVEGKVVLVGDVTMTDAAPEGGVGMVSDSLYATESSGMVGAEGYGDESAESMQALKGGDERERMLGTEAGGSQSETERKPAMVESIAAATLEVSDSTKSQYPEVESNKDDLRARYLLPPLDKDGFQVSCLVWSKLKGHPWWPGEIFDPSDASELALKHQKKGKHLVAYFGDNTLAWCDEFQLKPFMTNYSQMEKQSSSDIFINSVNHALEELSRRILSMMSCSCRPEELSDNGMSYMVENSRLRNGVTCSTVNQAASYLAQTASYLTQCLPVPVTGLFEEGQELVTLPPASTAGRPSLQTSVELAATDSSPGLVERAQKTVRGSAYDIGWLQRDQSLPPTEDGTARFLEILDSVIKNDHKLPDSMVYLLGPGLFSNHGPLYFVKTKSYFSKMGLACHIAKIHSESSVIKNAREIKEYIQEIYWGSRKCVLLLGHSKGGVDAATALFLYWPQLKDKVAGLALAQSPYGEFDIYSDDVVNELPVKKRAQKRRMHRLMDEEIALLEHADKEFEEDEDKSTILVIWFYVQWDPGIMEIILCYCLRTSNVSRGQ